jgi:hypothetical protein
MPTSKPVGCTSTKLRWAGRAASSAGEWLGMGSENSAESRWAPCLWVGVMSYLVTSRAPQN